MMKKLLTILFLVFGLSAANAATWYVSTTGSDANSGANLSAAKLTINGAITVASNGDVIRVANGTYAGAVTISDKRLTIYGENNGFTTGAIITGNIAVTVTGGSASSRVVFDNLAICGSGSLNTISGAALSIASSYVTIQNCNVGFAGTGRTIGTTPGAGYALVIAKPSSYVVLRDLKIYNTTFSSSAVGLLVDEDVAINEGNVSSGVDDFVISGCNFTTHAASHIYFAETVYGAADSDLGQVEWVKIENTIFQNHTATNAGLGTREALTFNKLKNATFDHIMIQMPNIATAANVRYCINANLMWQDYSNLNFTNGKTIIDGLNVTAGAFRNKGFYLYARNDSAATGGTIHRNQPATLTGITIDGWQFKNTHDAIRVGEYAAQNVTVKNCYIPRSFVNGAATNANCILLDQYTFLNYNGTTPTDYRRQSSYLTSTDIIDNNYFGDVTLYQNVTSVYLKATNGSNILNTDATYFNVLRNTDAGNSYTGKYLQSLNAPQGWLFPNGTLAPDLITGSSTTSITTTNNSSSDLAGRYLITDNSNTFGTTPIMIHSQAWNNTTVTNTRTNGIFRHNSSDVYQADYSSAKTAIEAGTNFDIIRNIPESSIVTSVVTAGDVTLLLSGADRFGGSYVINFANFTVASGTTTKLMGDFNTTGTLTVNGTLDLNGYALIVNGTIAGIGEIKGGTAGSSIFYNSSSNSNLKMASGFTGLDLLVMNGSGTLTLASNVTVSKQLRTAAGTLALNGFTLTIEGSGINPTGGSIDASVASSTISLNTAYPVSLANIVGTQLVLTRSIAGDLIAPGSSVFASINLLGGNYGLTSGSTLVLSESSNFSGIGAIYASGTSTLQSNYATTPGALPSLFGFGTISFTGAASATLGAITAPGSGLTINFSGPGVLGDITGDVVAINSTAGTGAGTIGNISGNLTTLIHSSALNLTVGNIGGNVTTLTLTSASRTGTTTLGNITGTLSFAGLTTTGSSGNIVIGSIKPLATVTLTIGNTGNFTFGDLNVNGFVPAFTKSAGAGNVTIGNVTGSSGTLGVITHNGSGTFTIGTSTVNVGNLATAAGSGVLSVGNITGTCGTISSSAAATAGGITVGNISGNCGAITHRSGGVLNVGTIGGTCAGIDLNSSNRTGSSTIGNITGNVVMTANINGNGSINIGNIRPSAAVTLLPNVSANITIGNIDATNGAFGFTKSGSTSGTVTIGNITAGSLGNITNNGSTNMTIGNVVSGAVGTVTNSSTGSLTIGTVSGNCGTITHNTAGSVTVGQIGGTLAGLSLGASRSGNTSIANGSTIANLTGVATLTISGTGTVNIGSFTLITTATNFTISTTTGGNGGAVTLGNITATAVPTFTTSAGSGPLTVGNITGASGNISINATSGSVTIGNISGNCGTITHPSASPLTIGTIGGTCGAISYSATTSTGNATIGTITGAVASLTVNTAATTCSLSFTGAVTITGTAAFTSGRCVLPGTTTLNGTVTAGASGVIIGGDNTNISLANNMTVNNTFPTTDPYVNNLTLNKGGAFTFTLAGTLRVKNTLTLTAGTLTLGANRLRVGNLAHTGGNILTTNTADLYIFNAPTADYAIPFSATTPALDTLSISPSAPGSFTYSFGNGLTGLGTLVNSSNLTMSAGTGFTTLARVNHSAGTLTTPATLLATITTLNLSGGNFASGAALTTVTTLNQTGGVFNASTTLANMTTLGISAGTFNVGRTIGTTVATAINHSGGTIAFAPSTFFLGAATYTASGTPILDIKDADGILTSGTTLGNFRLSTNRTFSSAGTYNYTGSAPQVTGSGLPSSVTELGINNSSNVSLTNDVTVTSTFNRTAGSLNLNDKRLTYSSNSTTDLYLVGSTSAKLSLTGSTGNVALRFTTSGTLSDLVINRAGSPTISFISGSLSPTVTGTMALTNGLLTTSSAAYLTLDNGATYTGGSDASHIRGPMRKIGGTAFTFPIGKTGRYAPAGISATGNASSQFSAEYFAGTNVVTFDTNSRVSSIKRVTGKEYWDISRIAGTESVNITLHYLSGSFSRINAPVDIRVCHFTGGQWQDLGAGGFTGNGTAGTVTANLQPASFSPFTFGTTTESNPLPVTLTKFTGRNVNGQAHLFWTTAAELNNSGFEIIKSTDGKNWSRIGFVKGVGTSNKVNNYAFTDVNLTVNSYYQLRQVDFDGKTTDSPTITVNASKTELSVVAYPNPFSTSLNLTIAANKTEKATITVMSAIGKVVSKTEVNLVSGANSTELQLTDLPAGIYTVRVVQANETATIKVVNQK